MRVEFGNPAPHHAPGGVKESLPGPAVTYLTIPDSYSVTPDADLNVVTKVLASAGTVTNLPGHEALLCVVRSDLWASHGDEPPTWVWSDNDGFADQLGAWFDCPIGRPDDHEATHHTNAGPPGVGV